MRMTTFTRALAVSSLLSVALATQAADQRDYVGTWHRTYQGSDGWSQDQLRLAEDGTLVLRMENPRRATTYEGTWTERDGNLWVTINGDMGFRDDLLLRPNSSRNSLDWNDYNTAHWGESPVAWQRQVGQTDRVGTTSDGDWNRDRMGQTMGGSSQWGAFPRTDPMRNRFVGKYVLRTPFWGAKRDIHVHLHQDGSIMVIVPEPRPHENFTGVQKWDGTWHYRGGDTVLLHVRKGPSAAATWLDFELQMRDRDSLVVTSDWVRSMTNNAELVLNRHGW